MVFTKGKHSRILVILLVKFCCYAKYRRRKSQFTKEQTYLWKPAPQRSTHACMHAQSLQLCLTPQILWIITCQAPLSLEFSRQEYWSGLPCPPLGDLSDPGIKPLSPALQVDSLLPNHQGRPQRSTDLPIS